MYSPKAISKDISNNLMNSSSSNDSSSFKHGFLDGGFLKSKEIMGLGSISSDLSQLQQQGNNSSLMRYRSAPSSYFASYLDADNNNNNNNSGDSSESESIFASFTSCNEQRNHEGLGGSGSVKMELNEVHSNPEMMNQKNGNGFLYQAAVSAGGGTVVGSYSVPLGVENQVQMRTNNNGNHSNLIRQSSSPAGFFSGFDVMREVGKFRSSNGETSSSTSGLNNHLNFSSGPSPTTRFMPSILEDASETLGAAGNQENVRLGNTDDNGRGYAPGFSSESWNDSAFNSLKRNRDGDLKIFSDFNGLENQDGEPTNYAHSLNRHLSLPKTASEMAAVEKYIQFQQDTGVPCKMRAKRGFATHPRSIAERMRRIRISDRMKKLQELFPNMDKQTNTADMLDLAVEYIKDLQNQVQTLTETKAKCKCSK